MYEGHLSEDAVLVSDKSKASRNYAEDRQIPILQLKGESTSEMADILFEKKQNVGKVTRWKDLKAMEYPDFVVERYMGAKEKPENPTAEDMPF